MSTDTVFNSLHAVST